jgi:hypothetical protein
MITNFLTKVTIASIGAVLVLGSSSFIGVESAQAANLVGPLNNLQGIDDLVVGDTVYDVRFRTGSFNSTFDNPAGAKPLPTFLDDAPGAIAAVNAINTFFNSVNFGDNFGPPRDGILGNVSTQYLVPFLADTSNNGDVSSKRGLYPASVVGDWTLGSDLIDERNASQTPSYVEFINGRAVPTPALLPGLFALGAGALRKRKQQAASAIA